MVMHLEESAVQTSEISSGRIAEVRVLRVLSRPVMLTKSLDTNPSIQNQARASSFVDFVFRCLIRESKCLSIT
jgi:hypothetical protein